MRVLVVSDIHGNWEALRAVAGSEQADRVLCLGDIVAGALDGREEDAARRALERLARDGDPAVRTRASRALGLPPASAVGFRSVLARWRALRARQRREACP